jgi:hypothetical protein
VAVDEIAELVARWRSADGRVAREQAATELARALGTLPAEDRLVLARGLADLGVTDLAGDVVTRADRGWSRIEVTNASRQLLSLDPGSLDGLVAGLADPRTVDHLRTRVHDAAATVTGADDDLDLSGVDLSAAGFAPPRLDLDDLPPPGDGAPGADLPPPPASTSDDGPGPPAVGTPPTAPTAPAPESRARLATPEQPATTSPEVADGRDAEDLPAVPVAEDLPVVPVAEELIDAVRRASTTRERLREVRAMAGHDLDDHGFRAVLTALPDGWQRRRAARRLVQGGEVHDVDAAAVLDSFAAPGDRIAVASELIRAGLATAETVADALPPGAADRLRRRATAPRGV